MVVSLFTSSPLLRPASLRQAYSLLFVMMMVFTLLPVSVVEAAACQNPIEIFYTIEFEVDFPASCSSADRDDVVGVLSAAMDFEFKKAGVNGRSTNKICVKRTRRGLGEQLTQDEEHSTPGTTANIDDLFSAVAVQRELWKGRRFVYHGGGRCYLCFRDNGDHRLLEDVMNETTVSLTGVYEEEGEREGDEYDVQNEESSIAVSGSSSRELRRRNRPANRKTKLPTRRPAKRKTKRPSKRKTKRPTKVAHRGTRPRYYKKSCRKQSRYLGEFANVDQCLRRAQTDRRCTSGLLMYSEVYKSWGCRCCAKGSRRNTHNLWDLYTFKTRVRPKPRTKRPTKRPTTRKTKRPTRRPTKLATKRPIKVTHRGTKPRYYKKSCRKQSRYLGVFANVDQCLRRAQTDQHCTSGLLMYSQVYKSWGCRCCAKGGSSSDSPLWDLYTFKTRVRPKPRPRPRTKRPTKKRPLPPPPPIVRSPNTGANPGTFGSGVEHVLPKKAPGCNRHWKDNGHSDTRLWFQKGFQDFSDFRCKMEWHLAHYLPQVVKANYETRRGHCMLQNIYPKVWVRLTEVSSWNQANPGC